LKYFFALSLLIPLFQRPHLFVWWILATSSVAISSVVRGHSFAVLWTCFSLAFGNLVGFLFVEKGMLARRYRMNHMASVTKVLGFVILGFWTILILRANSWSADLFVPSRWWWFAWIG